MPWLLLTAPLVPTMSNTERYPAIQLTPKEFELEVKSILDRLGLDLNNFSSKHREVVAALDGEYEIDVTVRFSVLEVEFLVLVECKPTRILLSEK
jgi:restriction system protein